MQNLFEWGRGGDLDEGSKVTFTAKNVADDGTNPHIRVKLWLSVRK